MGQEAYVHAAGGCCPVCRSGQLVGESFDYEAARVWQHIRCLACGASWTDVYHLQGFEGLELPDELPQEEQMRLLREVLRNRDLHPHDVLELADGVAAALLALPAIQEHIRTVWPEEHERAAEEAAAREEDGP
jgi:hypothetical protein